MNRQAIAKLVDAALREHQRDIGDFVFSVPDEAVTAENETWQVIIVPNRLVDRKSALYDTLNEIEDEIAREHGIDVMIVPAAPEHAG